MADGFHFLRPWWLAAMPVGFALIVVLFRVQWRGGAWSRVVDRALQPLVLRQADGFSGRRVPLAAALAAWAVATAALAGPAWERLPVPAFRSADALVVALDLSRSMDAQDLAPSRLSRAKLKMLSLLDRRAGGQTGLVVFSEHAFTVAPLTTDSKTIASLVAALSTDIMPTHGSRLAAGLERSAELLRRAGAAEGRILLMTDASPSSADLAAARALRAEGIEIDVLAVGTEDGAPIPERDGGFLTDGQGNVVIPRLDTAALAALAESGGGEFSPLTADETDLARLEPAIDPGAPVAAADDELHTADVWRDAGLWLTVLLLPLLALGFRRGWVAAAAGCVLLPVPDAGAQPSTGPQPAVETGIEVGAEAGDSRGLTEWWMSLWRRPDQRGAAELAEDRPARAARLFEDPEWRAAAEYRAGNFEASAASLRGLDTPGAHYNRGNALARAGNLRSAIDAYERALELDPAHADARHNRDLLEELLEQSEPPPEQQASAGREPDQGEGERDSEGDRSPDSQAGAGEPQSGPGEDGESGEQQAEAASGASSPDDEGTDDAAGEERFAEADRPEDDGDVPAGDTDAEQADGDDDASGDPAPTSADDLDRWASDQAAEQWLRRIPQDPGGLLRRKFLYQYQRLGLDQEGNYLFPDEEVEPW